MYTGIEFTTSCNLKLEISLHCFVHTMQWSACVQHNGIDLLFWTDPRIETHPQLAGVAEYNILHRVSVGKLDQFLFGDSNDINELLLWLNKHDSLSWGSPNLSDEKLETLLKLDKWYVSEATVKSRSALVKKALAIIQKQSHQICYASYRWVFWYEIQWVRTRIWRIASKNFKRKPLSSVKKFTAPLVSWPAAIEATYQNVWISPSPL